MRFIFILPPIHHLSGSGPVDYDHSVDSDTIQISAYITPKVASDGTDVSIK